MPFLKTIIPSLDRPCQLHLLLESIEKNWRLDQLDIYILYKYSDDEFKAGYDLLIDRYKEKDNIVFIKETDFSKQIKTIVCASIGHVAFLVDDCIWYRKTDLTPANVYEILKNDHDILTFSFRLGLNTTIQNYLTGETQKDLKTYGYLYFPNNNTIKWRWKLHPPFNNYSYLFSWDSHIYNANWLFDIIKDMKFTNPRGMEARISSDPNIRNKQGQLYFSSLDKSCVIVNTINAVQDNSIPSGIMYSYSPKELNKLYLDGSIIDIEGFDFSEISSCHYEFPLKFKRY